MMLFGLSAALLLLLGGLIFLPALLGWRSGEGFDRARLNLLLHRQREREFAAELASPDSLERLAAESERNLLGELEAEAGDESCRAPETGRRGLVIALILLPVATLVLYLMLGRPDLLDRPPDATLADTREAIQRLSQRLEQNPNDLQGWVLLGRSLQVTQRPEAAARAYEFALKLTPESLELKTYYAEALAEANQGSMQGRPAEIAREILAQDPNHKTALWMAGLAAAESREVDAARRYWEKLKSLLPAGSEEAEEIAGNLARLATLVPAAKTASSDEPKRPASVVRVRVLLDEALRAQVAADDTLFVFARAASGPPMPLAVVRKEARDLPLEVVLDDSMAMQPGMNLSAFERVVVGARISKAGQPIPQAGDLQGLLPPMQVGPETAVSVTIDQVIEAK